MRKRKLMKGIPVKNYTEENLNGKEESGERSNEGSTGKPDYQSQYT